MFPFIVSNGEVEKQASLSSMSTISRDKKEACLSANDLQEERKATKMMKTFPYAIDGVWK